MPHVLGIDTSTTATKAVLVDDAGTVVAVGSAGYDFETPRPLWAEQDPHLWWDATVLAVRSALEQAEVSGESVEAIGLTGQMHGLVVADAEGTPLRPAILWNDQRTAAECDAIRQRVGRDRLVAITGNDALTGFTAPKILWVRNHEPDVLGQARHLLLPKDHVRFRLSGVAATDKAGASGTQLFDLEARDWSGEVLDALEIDAGLLPPTHEGADTTSVVSAAAAESTGLRPGTPIVAGGGDQAANAVGTGVIDPGSMALSLGTSGVVFAAANRPAYEPQGKVHAFCHAAAGRWHLMGVMLSAAGSLRWFRDTFAPGVGFGELVAEAESVPAGAEGLLFLPYLTGERTPHPDPLARGGFVGLTVRHERRHLVRAVLEGVAFGLRDGLDLMLGAGLDQPNQIRASGGGTRSDLWRQILGDVLRADIASVTSVEGAAYGAAGLAAVGAGWFPDEAAMARAWVAVTDVTSGAGDDYTAMHDLYAEQYAVLRSTFHRLSGPAAP